MWSNQPHFAMRRILSFAVFLLFHFSSFNLYSGHEQGGAVITYESVAHVNGNSLEYVISVYRVFDLAGITPSTDITINIDGCAYDYSVILPRISASGPGGLSSIAGLNYCVSASFSPTDYGLGVYTDTIVLPGVCPNFRISYISGGLSPYLSADNISPAHNDAYFSVLLNNVKGPNSSPQFDRNDLLIKACLNQPLSLYGFSEPDGDSVLYSASRPQQIIPATGVISNIPYNPGFSVNNPVGASGGNYSVDSLTGTVSTQLSNIGSYIVTIRYVEYRYDSAAAVWDLIGVSRFNVLLIGSGICQPVPFNLIYPPGTTDSLDCLEDKIRIAATRKLASPTMTTSGSEFQVNSALQGNIAVSSARVIQDSIIELQLATPVPPGDIITITAANGTDGNVINSICGDELLPSQDTIRYFSRSGTPLNANFTYTINRDTVWVNASSSSGALSYSWDFGDGNSANGINAEHIYDSSGTFVVSLIVLNECGVSDTSLIPVTVVPCDVPLANWTYTIISSGSTGMQIQFDGSSSQGVSYFEWNFGDGNTNNTSLMPMHVYVTPTLTYRVSLTVYNECNESNTMTYRLNEISLEEFSKEKLKIYPNPAQERIMVEWGQGTNFQSIDIVSLKGQNIRRHIITPLEREGKKLNIDLSGIGKGAYFIQLKGEDLIIIKKLMVAY